jgi:hypothetical protein
MIIDEILALHECGRECTIGGCGGHRSDNCDRHEQADFRRRQKSRHDHDRCQVRCLERERPE